jgi:drug/metabolite transporter (DMT)-like permease
MTSTDDMERDDPPTTSSRRRLGASLTIPNLLLLLFAVIAAATGQLMLKHGMTGVAETVSRDGGSVLLRAATAPWVIGGLAVFGISALAWLTTLSRVPLSVAYPFNALGLLIIVGSSVVVLHEKVSLLAWVGVLGVVGGLILVVVSQTGQ